jgi:hypothetical protein
MLERLHQLKSGVIIFAPGVQKLTIVKTGALKRLQTTTVGFAV